MDVAREPRSAAARRLVPAGAAIGLAACAVVAWLAISHTPADEPAVDRSTIVTDVARIGTLERSISATGTIESQDLHVVAATEPGVVEGVYVKPGARVASGQAIAQLSNPDLDSDAVAAASALDVAQAQLRSAQQEARAAELAQESSLSSARAQSEEDRTKLASLHFLHKNGYIADQTVMLAGIAASHSSEQLRLARSQVSVDAAQQDAKVAAARAQVEQAAAVLNAKRSAVEALAVRARSNGVVQSVSVDPGARLEAGAEVARIADQSDLKAVLAVPEGQVRAVSIGLSVRIDTGSDAIAGRVERIAPAAQNGTVAVDVALPRSLPSSARPESNVEGRIGLQSLHNVLVIARPAGAQDDSVASLYRLDGTSVARVVRVHLGRGSADRIAVVAGLRPGDTVIVSDMSANGGAPVIHLR